MARRLRIYQVDDGSCVRVVAAANQANAARRLGATVGDIRTYGHARDPSLEYEIDGFALLVPGIAWQKRSRKREAWHPVAGPGVLEAVMKARFPEQCSCHLFQYTTGRYEVIHEKLDGYLGYGADADSAWADAFRRTWLDPPERVQQGAVTVWRFRDAPIAYQELSPHGGDEGHVAWVPPGFSEAWTKWLEAPWFGNSVSVHPIRVGEVRIGAHT